MVHERTSRPRSFRREVTRNAAAAVEEGTGNGGREVRRRNQEGMLAGRMPDGLRGDMAGGGIVYRTMTLQHSVKTKQGRRSRPASGYSFFVPLSLVGKSIQRHAAPDVGGQIQILPLMDGRLALFKTSARK